MSAATDNGAAVATAPEAPGRRRRGAHLEDAILDAAWEELVEVGWSAFSVENVAARARTGKASIYRRWPTKQQLVVDVLTHRVPTPCADDLGMTSWDDATTTAEALRRVGRYIATTMTSPAGQAVRAVKFEAANDPDFARLVEERFQAPRREMMLALLRRGVARGEVRPEAVTATVADVLPAVLVHRVAMQGEQPTPALLRDVVDNVLIPLVEAR